MRPKWCYKAVVVNNEIVIARVNVPMDPTIRITNDPACPGGLCISAAKIVTVETIDGEPINCDTVESVFRPITTYPVGKPITQFPFYVFKDRQKTVAWAQLQYQRWQKHGRPILDRKHPLLTSHSAVRIRPDARMRLNVR